MKKHWKEPWEDKNYKWRAVDGTGRMYYYTAEPYIKENDSFFNNSDRSRYFRSLGKTFYANDWVYSMQTYEQWQELMNPEPRELTFGQAMVAKENGEKIEMWQGLMGEWNQPSFLGNITSYINRRFRIKPKVSVDIPELKKKAYLV